MTKKTFSSNEDFIIYLKENKIQEVDFRFTDTLGTWHHITFHRDAVTPSLLEDGIAFDGSSIPGWKPIHNSDMILHPALDTLCEDPFRVFPTVSLICNVVDPDTDAGYTRDPRTTALKAEDYLRATGFADQAIFGPEPEFFVFDRVHFDTSDTFAFYNLYSDECNSPSTPFFGDNQILHDGLAHRPSRGTGYTPCPPVDRLMDLRAEMLDVLKNFGISVLKHHHEVASAQHELGFDCASLTKTADNLQIFKYALRNLAHDFNKTVTFMPKPIAKDNGSGMHVHQSLWHKDKPIFYGDKYNELSQEALYYIGGILKHARALNALTNPTTNSYKRLVPGFEAPVFRAYSARNRSAAIRIPYSKGANAKRIEVRFPDPAANPYLALSAMLMAGLDGIENKIHPGDAMETNLYEVDVSALDQEHLLAPSLEQALKALDEDRSFLTKGDVFTDDQIDAIITLKKRELDDINQYPTAAEFKHYYSC